MKPSSPKTETEPLNQPGHWDVMLSYTQRNAVSETIAQALFGEFEKRGVSVWLDVKMIRKDVAAMEEGVRNSKCVIAIVSGPVIDPQNLDVKPEDNAYFKREFCKARKASTCTSIRSFYV